MQQQLSDLSIIQEKISMRLDSLEIIRKSDAEEMKTKNKKIIYHLERIDIYINKQKNYKEFKETQKTSFRKNILTAGAVMTILVVLTGWGFFEKGLYTPVPPNATLNANN